MLPCVSNATEEADPLAGFAALMAGAGAEVKGDPDPAPYGYTKDEQTGEMRPKKSPGRPRKSPSLDDLKERQAAEPGQDASPPPGDRAPAAPKGRKGRARTREARPAPPVPQSLRMEGSIAKGINRLYRRAGKIAIAFGAVPEGTALIEITRADEPDDVTVGDAWEALCKANPRIRAFWVRALSGSAWSQVFMCHAPVVIAFITRPGVLERIPFAHLFGAFADDEGDGDGGQAAGPPAGGLFAGLTQEDVAQAMAFAQQMSGRDPGNGGPPRGDTSG